MKKILFLIVCVIVIFLASCASVYRSPDASNMANTHNVIALLPPKITIEAARYIEAEAIKEQQRSESKSIQQSMYSSLLQRKAKGKLNIQIQGLQNTNTLLAKAGYFDDLPLSIKEINEILGVDGIITSNFLFTKPISEEGAMAEAILTGDNFFTTTHETTVNIDIYDGPTQEMIWNYHDTVSGNTYSSRSNSVAGILEQASRKMPY